MPDPAATEQFGLKLAKALVPGLVVYLEGELGAGKTALTRAVLHGLGYSGRVRSPTYTLAEVYAISSLDFHHYDFYRLAEPEEFLDAGFGDAFDANSVSFVEWPDKAAGVLPPADLRIVLAFDGDGRRCRVAANSDAGRICLSAMIPMG